MGPRFTSRRWFIYVAVASLLAWVIVLSAAAPASALFGCGLNPFCLGGKAIGGATSSIAGDAITALAKAILGALGSAIGWASTLWVGVGTPALAGQSGQATGTVAFLQQNLLEFTTGLAVLSTLIGAARIVYHEHKAAQLRELGRYLATYALVSSAAAAAASILVGGCDQMASWFIGQASANSNFADHLANLLGLATLSSSHAAGAPAGFAVGLAGTATTAFVAIALGIMAFLAAVIQIMLMLVRGGMLVLLVGTLPLVAAFSNTEMGHQWFRKACAWLVAFALYKPAAAIVYAVAFDLAGQPGALSLLDGVMTLVLAILALPALLRFVVPATSALAGGGGAGAIAAGAAGGAIAMRMPTGAATVAATPASAYGQGQAGGGGPSGASSTASVPLGALASAHGDPGQAGGSGATGQTGAAGAGGQRGGAGVTGPAGGSGASGAHGGAGAAGAAGDAGAAGAAGGAGAAGAAGATGGVGMAVMGAQQAARGAGAAAHREVEGEAEGSQEGGPTGDGGSG